MGRRTLILSLMIVMAIAAMAQSPIRLSTVKPEPADSSDIAYYGKRHFWQAAATVGGMNLGVWAYDRYVQNAEFAKISWDSFKENLSHGFIWDNDQLGTNMFLHPYHGNLYYNGARSNGFNYWQSGLFAFAGSAMWELVMEQEYPSTNDIICTPIGGMAIGETLFRASDIVLKDNTRGWERFGREAAAFLISPMRGLTRIINGDAWRYRPTSGRLFGIPNIAMEVSLGGRWLKMQNKYKDGSWGASAEVNIEYGDRFELHSTTPFDYFTVHLNLGIQRKQPVISQLNIMGRLLSRELIEDKNNELSIGMYQHYDFYDSDTISHRTAHVPYKLGVPASFGAGIMYRAKNLGSWTIDAYSHVNAVILGGILSDHYHLKDRNYNLASGFSLKNGVNFVYKKDLLSISAGYDYFRMYTWGYPRNTDMNRVNLRTLNAEGDASTAYFAITQLRVDYRLNSQWYLTGSFDHYMRSTRYRDFPKVKSSSFSTRLMITYKF